MDDKPQVLRTLRDELARWDELLGRMSTEMITLRQFPGGWSIQDVLAHLMTWQRRSIARLEAGLHEQEPKFPDWPAGIDPSDEEPLVQINDWIYQTHRNRRWDHIYANWKAGFLYFLELGEAIPEKNLFEVGRYPWLGDFPLAVILTSSYEHHREHREILLDWLKEKDNQPTSE